MSQSDDELRERAWEMTGSGMTYAQVAAQFVRDGVPGTWTRTTVERLMGSPDSPSANEGHTSSNDLTASEARALRTKSVRPAAPSDPDRFWEWRGGGWYEALAPTPAQHRAVTMFWTRVIGWIVLVWAILSVVMGAWVATTLLREASSKDDERSGAASTAYEECIVDPGKDYEDCEGL